MVYIALCALILGIIFGQFVLDSTWIVRGMIYVVN